MDAFHGMYAAFQANTDGTAFRKTEWAKKNWDIYSKYLQKDVKIKVVGVWDTVGSLGLPETGFVSYFNWNKGYRFHNTMLDEGMVDLKLTSAWERLTIMRIIRNRACVPRTGAR